MFACFTRGFPLFSGCDHTACLLLSRCASRGLLLVGSQDVLFLATIFNFSALMVRNGLTLLNTKRKLTAHFPI